MRIASPALGDGKISDLGGGGRGWLWPQRCLSASLRPLYLQLPCRKLGQAGGAGVSGGGPGSSGGGDCVRIHPREAVGPLGVFLGYRQGCLCETESILSRNRSDLHDLRGRGVGGARKWMNLSGDHLHWPGEVGHSRRNPASTVTELPATTCHWEPLHTEPSHKESHVLREPLRHPG